MSGWLRSCHVARSGCSTGRGLVGPTRLEKFGSRPSELETDSSPEIDSIGGNRGKKAKWASNTELNQTGPIGA